MSCAFSAAAALLQTLPPSVRDLNRDVLPQARTAPPKDPQLTLVGVLPKRKRRAPPPDPTVLVVGGVTTVFLPIRTVSENNKASHEHFMVRVRRAKDQREGAARMLSAKLGEPLELPVHVHLVRVTAGSGLDAHDNLPGALKHVVDGIADWLGVKDRDPRVSWSYDQQRGSKGTNGVRVEFTEAREP